MSPDVGTEIVWHGDDALKPLLVGIDDLEPFPGNPRLGDTAALVASLKRFGQVKPIVIDRGRIVAGHHIVKAAQEEGWTHVAAHDHRFADEEEQRAFLVADNRIADLGTYENALLLEQLQALAEFDGLEGTGYTLDDLDDMLAQQMRADAEPVLPPEPIGEAPASGPELREVVLLYAPDQRDQLETWLKIVAKAEGTDGLSETVYAAVRFAAHQTNLGDEPATPA